ncbi:MAG: nucleotidyltransferase domain-containing protein [Candidatus Diapherotrites archaeon]
MDKRKEFNVLKRKIIPVLKKYNVKKAGVFGSYARYAQKKSSDVDLLIQPPNDFSLVDLAGLEIVLEKLLRKRVEVLSYNGLSPFLRSTILREEVRII